MIKINCKEDLLKCMRNELVPDNPMVEYTGIRGLLQFLANGSKNKTNPECIYTKYEFGEGWSGKSKTAECFETIYGIDPFEIGNSDTIFNCLSFLSRFTRGMIGEDPEETMKIIDDTFAGFGRSYPEHDGLREKLDKLADYHHSLANFMPAPDHFRVTKLYDGKGRVDQDNDMPDLYYERAETKFPEKYQWINENMDRFALGAFKDFKSYLKNGEANEPLDFDNPDRVAEFEKSIDSAIDCLEKRAEELWDLRENFMAFFKNYELSESHFFWGDDVAVNKVTRLLGECNGGVFGTGRGRRGETEEDIINRALEQPYMKKAMKKAKKYYMLVTGISLIEAGDMMSYVEKRFGNRPEVMWLRSRLYCRYEDVVVTMVVTDSAQEEEVIEDENKQDSI